MKQICFDLETTGLDVHTCRILGIAITIEPLKAYYVSIPEDKKRSAAIFKRFQIIFEDDTIAKIGHNLKFDINVLRSHGINVRGPIIDTMVMDYNLRPNDKKHGLKSLSLLHLNYKQQAFKDIARKVNGKLTIEGVDPKIVTPYACEDGDQTIQLYNHLQPIIDQFKLNVPCQRDFDLVKVLASMEYNGVEIDKVELKKVEKQVLVDIASAKKIVEKFTKGDINLASSAQVSSFLFDKLHLIPIGQKGKNGHYSVSKNVLSKLIGKHDIIPALLDYRALTTVKNTFIKALKAINPITKRLHTSFNLTSTSTGRLSSSEPNLQNIPSRSVGKQLRAVFVAKESHIFIGADYSNIELRVAAHLSQDSTMLNSYKNGVDVHALTASKIFNIKIKEVEKNQRDVAKTVNFGLLYGMSASGLSKKLELEKHKYSPEQCQQFINDFFELYEGVADFRDKLIERATIKGYAETMIGRRRPLPEIQSNNTAKREAAKRQALNSPIQGTAADILKIAMVNIFRRINQEGLKSKMLLQVHDELLIEAPEAEEKIMSKLVRHEMENAVALSIPLKVDLKTGKTWQDVH